MCTFSFASTCRSSLVFKKCLLAVWLSMSYPCQKNRQHFEKAVILPCTSTRLHLWQFMVNLHHWISKIPGKHLLTCWAIPRTHTVFHTHRSYSWHFSQEPMLGGTLQIHVHFIPNLPVSLCKNEAQTKKRKNELLSAPTHSKPTLNPWAI